MEHFRRRVFAPDKNRLCEDTLHPTVRPSYRAEKKKTARVKPALAHHIPPEDI